MKKKLLILDIDGTLTNSKKEITPATQAALLETQKAGTRIVLATGRPVHGVQWIADALHLQEYGGFTLCFNGARIEDVSSGRILYQQKLSDSYIAPLYEYALQHNIGLVTYEGEDVVTGTRIDPYMEKEASLNHMKLRTVENFPEYVQFPVNKCLFTAPVDTAPQFEKELADLYGTDLSIYRSEPFFIEVMPQGVDKAASLKHLFEALHIDRSEAVACGDGFNDRSMIEYAGVGVAMANAQEPIKQVADYVTDRNNDEDGLVEVIERYFV